MCNKTSSANIEAWDDQHICSYYAKANIINQAFQLGLAKYFNSLVIRKKKANLKTEVTRKQSSPNFPKNEYFLPLVRTHRYAYKRVRNVRFLENLASFAFLLPPFSDSPFSLITDELASFYVATLLPRKTHIIVICNPC